MNNIFQIRMKMMKLMIYKNCKQQLNFKTLNFENLNPENTQSP